MRLICTMVDKVDSNLAECIVGLFTVFYIDDGYIASCEAEFLQRPLTSLLRLSNVLASP